MPSNNSSLPALLSDPARVLFLDIETTGLSRYYDELTLVGYRINGVHHTYITGDDPSHMLKTVANAGALVTFNGTLFDLPFLRKTFQNIEFPAAHVDLRYAARRVGLAGGQKIIEKLIGLSIRDEVADVDGWSAVLLWHQYLGGNRKALRKLIAYNIADVRGMTAILDYVIHKSNLTGDLFLKSHSFFETTCQIAGWGRPRARLPEPARLNRQPVTFNSLFAKTPASNSLIVGIDLTGSEKRPSGFCVLRGQHARTRLIRSDNEMIDAIKDIKPQLVSIDSPLSLPRGRTRVTDDDPVRNTYGIMRECERTLKRRGINVYPCLLPSMQRLTERGMAMATLLRSSGIPVIESYPGAAQDIIGIPRKGAGIELLRDGLRGFGISGPYISHDVSHDELDSITSALVGSFFLAGKSEALRAPEEGALIIPDLHAAAGPLIVGISGPIASGKTAAAKILEAEGFAYTRFSQVIDKIIADENKPATREMRQSVGWRIHEQFGQRWLCERVIEQVGDASKIVVDGLRFPEDFSYLFERFGSRFVHLHLVASTDIRAERAKREGVERAVFEEAEQRNTEGQIDKLERLDARIIQNEMTLLDLRISVLQCIEAYRPNAHT